MKTSSKSLQTELNEVKGENENEDLKKKIENLEKKDKKRWDLLEKIEEIAEQRKIQLEALEIQIKSRHIETKRCNQGWICRRTDRKCAFSFTL